ncbi:hypothetical protein SASPL_140996 [Salvia splendens]|uniref:DOG1 domain-containing protein n=1 Tax=Salvia splendens TaxID=180675 RepID=A0A8X8WS29_SALSN|nr:hypothetical protein SASPL_140996 [Salvia splendens]
MASNKVSSNNKEHHHSTQIAQHHHMQHGDQINHHQNQNNNHMFSFGMMQSSTPFNISKESGAYDLGDLDQALFLYLDGQDQDQRQMRPHTLNIFPSEPMHGISSGSKKSSEPSNHRNYVQEPAKVVKREGNRKGPTSSSEQDGPKTPDPKAYVQQLESSRMKLTQLEHDIQRARAQEEMLMQVENKAFLVPIYLQMIALKSVLVKSDVFHIFSGMWRTPAERCFLWMGGVRPSELIKVEPLTEQQMVGIYGLQQSTQEAEEALSQGLEALNQSLTETIVCDTLTLPPNMNTYMAQMAVAISKLSTLEGFVRQADSLRQQTLHRLHQLLTTRQAARCILAIGEYFHRLRALSSLWLTRPRHD